MARDRSKDTALFKIVDLTSGSSGDGTHFRSIHVTFTDRDNITVFNEYCDTGPKGTFSLATITDEMETLKEASYFSDFCYALAAAVPGAKAIQQEKGWYATGVTGLAATPKVVDAEMAEGTRENVTTFKPIALGQGPKPFVLKLK